MIKALVYEDTDGSLVVSTDIWPGDEVIEIPPKLYDAYCDALRNLSRIENLIRECQRQQERERSYQD